MFFYIFFFIIIFFVVTCTVSHIWVVFFVIITSILKYIRLVNWKWQTHHRHISMLDILEYILEWNTDWALFPTLLYASVFDSSKFSNFILILLLWHYNRAWVWAENIKLRQLSLSFAKSRHVHAKSRQVPMHLVLRLYACVPLLSLSIYESRIGAAFRWSIFFHASTNLTSAFVVYPSRSSAPMDYY